MLRRHVALTTNQCSKQPPSVCNKKNAQVVPGLLSCSNPAGLTKKKTSIWSFMAQRRFRDAGLTPLTMLTTRMWACVCVCVCVNLMHTCMLGCCMCAEQHAFHQSRVGEIVFNEVKSASCPV